MPHTRPDPEPDRQRVSLRQAFEEHVPEELAKAVDALDVKQADVEFDIRFRVRLSLAKLSCLAGLGALMLRLFW